MCEGWRAIGAGFVEQIGMAIQQLYRCPWRPCLAVLVARKGVDAAEDLRRCVQGVEP
jgi:hypothetical protein